MSQIGQSLVESAAVHKLIQKAIAPSTLRKIQPYDLISKRTEELHDLQLQNMEQSRLRTVPVFLKCKEKFLGLHEFKQLCQIDSGYDNVRFKITNSTPGWQKSTIKRWNLWKKLLTSNYLDPVIYSNDVDFRKEYIDSLRNVTMYPTQIHYKYEGSDIKGEEVIFYKQIEIPLDTYHLGVTGLKMLIPSVALIPFITAIGISPDHPAFAKLVNRRIDHPSPDNTYRLKFRKHRDPLETDPNPRELNDKVYAILPHFILRHRKFYEDDGYHHKRYKTKFKARDTHGVFEVANKYRWKFDLRRRKTEIIPYIVHKPHVGAKCLTVVRDRRQILNPKAFDIISSAPFDLEQNENYELKNLIHDGFFEDLNLTEKNISGLLDLTSDKIQQIEQYKSDKGGNDDNILTSRKPWINYKSDGKPLRKVYGRKLWNNYKNGTLERSLKKKGVLYNKLTLDIIRSIILTKDRISDRMLLEEYRIIEDFSTAIQLFSIQFEEQLKDGFHIDELFDGSELVVSEDKQLYQELENIKTKEQLDNYRLSLLKYHCHLATATAQETSDSLQLLCNIYFRLLKDYLCYYYPRMGQFFLINFRLLQVNESIQELTKTITLPPDISFEQRLKEIIATGGYFDGEGSAAIENSFVQFTPDIQEFIMSIVENSKRYK